MWLIDCYNTVPRDESMQRLCSSALLVFREKINRAYCYSCHSAFSLRCSSEEVEGCVCVGGGVLHLLLYLRTLRPLQPESCCVSVSVPEELREAVRGPNKGAATRAANNPGQVQFAVPSLSSPPRPPFLFPPLPSQTHILPCLSFSLSFSSVL